MNWHRYHKAIAALVTAIAVAASQGLITGTAAKWAAVVIAVAGVFGIIAAPKNAD